ncbi:Catalase-related immune-responsive [compost metagenome]
MFDDSAKARFLETITGAVGGVQSLAIRERAIQYWTNVDTNLGAALRIALEAAPLAADEPGVTSEPAHS